MNVYYFMLSTCLISIKLFAAWIIGMRSKPAYNAMRTGWQNVRYPHATRDVVRRRRTRELDNATVRWGDAAGLG